VDLDLRMRSVPLFYLAGIWRERREAKDSWSLK
jgi:hypothetical protein